MVALGDNQQQRTLFAMAAHLLFGKRPDWHLIGVAALLLAVIATRAHSYLLFHTLVELFLIVVALTTFALAWNVRKHLDNPVLLLSSIALGPVAVLDALHMLAFKGMGVFPDDANLATQLWIAQRGLACAALLAAALLGPRRVSPQGALAVSTAAALALGGAIFSGLFPDCFVAGQGLTPFKVAAEYLMMAAFLITAARLWQLRAMFPPLLLRLLLAACVLSAVEEACFTLYVDVYGVLNMTGHVVAVVVGMLFYAGIVRYGLARPQQVLYGRLSELNERLADAALRDNERAALALDTLDGGPWDWDMAEGAPLLSARHAGWLGLPDGAVATQQAWRDRVLPEDRVAWETLAAPRPPGPAVSVEYRLRRADGSVAWFAGSSRTFLLGGAPRMIGLDRDVSARKAAEAERERLAEDVRRFSEILAHHLQEPARLQACYAQVLRRRLPEPVAPDLAEALAVIEDGANYLRRLLRDAHLYIVLDRLPPPDHPVDVVLAVRQAWDRLGGVVAECGARLEIGAVPPVWLAEARLVDLLVILLTNAVEYHVPGRAPRVTVAGGVADGEVVLSVADDGIGIHPRYHQQVFLPFERLHTQTQYPGTGIGLALARKIVERAGGRIWLESEPDRGTIVHVALPQRGQS